MGSNKFKVFVIARVLLITLSLFLTLVIFTHSRHYLSGIIFAVLSLLQVHNLIRFVEQTNLKLARFFSSIRHSDFSANLSTKGMGSGFEELGQSLNDIILEFRQARAEKEEQHNYLQTVVQHINIGILAFKRDGEVDMFNNAARRLLKTGHVNHLKQLGAVKEDFPDTILRMRTGDRSLIKLFADQELRQLLVYATEFKLRNEEYILVAMQDIHAELEEKETESWQKLIRVLTHEIMNSMTPISSLASTVIDLIKAEKEGEFASLDPEDLLNIISALETIQTRSQALLHFVEIYRNLTRIPKPSFRHFQVTEMLERIKFLMAPKLEEMGIQLTFKILPPDLMVTADPDLIDQVIINLTLNAIDALKGREGGRISLRAFDQDSGRVVIEISDNGHGITPDILDKIFMPFFTSKKEGSGIGLSLSRQIMHLHKGSISVKSTPGEGATFYLVF